MAEGWNRSAINPTWHGEITSPLFDRVTVTLDPRYCPGTTFTITTSNNVPGYVCIQSAS